MHSFSYLESVCCSMSSSNCCFLTCIQISQEAGQVVWYSHLFQNFPQFIVIHTVKRFGIVNKAEIDVFLELSCFFDDPADVGNFCIIDYAKAFDCMDHDKLWKILQEMGIPHHLTFLLRNLYTGHKSAVRTGHGTTDWFQIGKGICQGCILSPCLFNLYTEYIMRNTGLDEAQAGIKIARRNINNLRYADDTTVMAESEEELKSFLMKIKEESGKSWLKAQHSEN